MSCCQFLVQCFHCYTNHVVMVEAPKIRLRGKAEPYFVNQIDVGLPEVRRVRTEMIFGSLS